MEHVEELSLRERQKRNRRARIIAAAKSLFMDSGLEGVTMEAIADIAEVSSVTIHNYYGTKSGVLLAIIAESDRVLLENLSTEDLDRSESVVALMLRFHELVCAHTAQHLDKAIWRQVIAASVSDTEPRFGKLYHELDERLASVLIRALSGMVTLARLPERTDPVHLGWALFNLQNARFVEYVASADMTIEDSLRRLGHDLRALMPAGGPQD